MFVFVSFVNLASWFFFLSTSMLLSAVRLFFVAHLFFAKSSLLMDVYFHLLRCVQARLEAEQILIIGIFMENHVLMWMPNKIFAVPYNGEMDILYYFSGGFSVLSSYLARSETIYATSLCFNHFAYILKLSKERHEFRFCGIVVNP